MTLRLLDSTDCLHLLPPVLHLAGVIWNSIQVNSNSRIILEEVKERKNQDPMGNQRGSDRPVQNEHVK